jgi:hypothetical protein
MFIPEISGGPRAIVALGGQVFEHSAAEEFTERPFGARSTGRQLLRNISSWHAQSADGEHAHRRGRLQTNLALQQLRHRGLA